jgi:beta-hydroxylase
MLLATPQPPVERRRVFRFTKRAAKRVIPLALAIAFFPKTFAVCFGVGLIDVARNQTRTFETLDRYFAGNGIFTWLLAPFNLFMDLLSLPFRSRGIYKLADLPRGHQDEINAVIEAALRRDLVAQLESKLGEHKRGMIFWKWYGKDLDTTVDVPEFHERYKYVRTIGVSLFNKKASTGKHFGPLRVTLRVLYNINDIASTNVFIKVGNRTHYWRDNKLLIFDDTLQHQSVNQSDGVRYCMFLDILRPSLVPALTSAILSCIRVVIARFNFIFYKHWAFIR